MESKKKDIRTYTKEQLRFFFVEKGYQAFRGDQIYRWLWNKGVNNFEQMTNLPLAMRQMLESNFLIRRIQLDTTQHSEDGTIKNAVRLYDNLLVESVLIPSSRRATACISSQAGCSLDCKFCATARLKRMRNLYPDEIYDQVVTMNNQSKWYYGKPLTNIVFMGMGEPLMNYKNVLKAIEMITDEEGLGMSSRRITLSTSGIPKMIKKMADDNVKFNLAVSLHTAIQEVREKIMSFTTTFTLVDLRDALQYWYRKTRNKITYEYIVWKGINDQNKDIKALIDFCKFAPSKVNLIEYNPIDGGHFQQAAPKVIDNYITQLEKNGITVTVRRSRGKDIHAACGQLANTT